MREILVEVGAGGEKMTLFAMIFACAGGAMLGADGDASRGSVGDVLAKAYLPYGAAEGAWVVVDGVVVQPMGQVITLATGTYSVGFGSQGLLHDGVPVYDANDRFGDGLWAVAPETVTVEQGGMAIVEKVLRRYVPAGPWSCWWSRTGYVAEGEARWRDGELTLPGLSRTLRIDGGALAGASGIVGGEGTFDVTSQETTAYRMRFRVSDGVEETMLECWEGARADRDVERLPVPGVWDRTLAVPDSVALTASASFDDATLGTMPLRAVIEEDADSSSTDAGQTASPFTVPFGGEVTFQLGSAGTIATADRQPILVIDGVRYTHRAVRVAARRDREVPIRLNRVFGEDEYYCGWNSYAYDAAEPDARGTYIGWTALGWAPLRMEAGYRLRTTSAEHFGILGAGDALIVDGSRIYLETSTLDDVRLHSATMTGSSFTLALSSAARSAAWDLQCWHLDDLHGDAEEEAAMK